MEELKPCPFCGGEAIIILDLYVQCKICGAKGQAYFRRYEAIRKWNTRVEPKICVEKYIDTAKFLQCKHWKERETGCKDCTNLFDNDTD